MPDTTSEKLAGRTIDEWAELIRTTWYVASNTRTERRFCDVDHDTKTCYRTLAETVVREVMAHGSGWFDIKAKIEERDAEWQEVVAKQKAEATHLRTAFLSTFIRQNPRFTFDPNDPKDFDPRYRWLAAFPDGTIRPFATRPEAEAALLAAVGLGGESSAPTVDPPGYTAIDDLIVERDDARRERDNLRAGRDSARAEVARLTDLSLRTQALSEERLALASKHFNRCEELAAEVERLKGLGAEFNEINAARQIAFDEQTDMLRFIVLGRMNKNPDRAAEIEVHVVLSQRLREMAADRDAALAEVDHLNAETVRAGWRRQDEAEKLWSESPSGRIAATESQAIGLRADVAVLQKRVEHLTADRDAYASAALAGLAGLVYTPANGYVFDGCGPGLLANDMRRMRAEFARLLADIGRLTTENVRLEAHATAMDQHAGKHQAATSEVLAENAGLKAENAKLTRTLNAVMVTVNGG